MDEDKPTRGESGPVRSIDVARLAGVSRSAVSRTFTKGASVSPETRERVLEAAEALGYRPNALARTLITRRSGIVGLVFADIVNPFYASALEKLSQHLQETGFSPLLFVCRDASDLDQLIPTLLSYQVDGVVIAAATLSSTMARHCARAGRPVVLFNRYVQFGGVSSIACDNQEVGRLAADHLADGGRGRIAFMAGLENTSSSRDRERGFVERLATRGLRLSARDVGDYGYDPALSAARRLLACPPYPDAIFCANDLMALAVLDVARSEIGLVVPDDLAVIGVDNIALAAWRSHDLTSIDQEMARMAAAAIDVLVGQIEAPDQGPVRRLIRPVLHVRGSTHVAGRKATTSSPAVLPP